MSIATPENIRSALTFISPDVPREEWVKIGMALKDGLNGGGFDVFSEWSKSGGSYSKADAQDTWNSIKANGNGVTVGTLFYLAGQNGWKPNGEARQETEAERQEREQQRQEKAEAAAKVKATKAEAAAAKAAALWNVATPALADHPYLQRKSVAAVPALRELPADRAAEILGYTPKSDGEPLAGRLLIAPVEIAGKISTAELIDEAGRKAAIAGGAKSGGFWAAQPLPEGDGSGLVLAIGEGIATVLTAKEAAEHHTIAALTDSNIVKVAKAMRDRCPASQILILSDVGNGQVKAKQAAHETGEFLAVPFFTQEQKQQFKEKEGKPPSDFNDLAALAGLEEVKAQIAKAARVDSLSNEVPVKPKIDFDEPVYDFPHVTETGRKRATIANLRHLFKSYGITVSYDELLKKQTIRFNNAHDKGHRDLIDNAGVAHIRSLMALNGLTMGALDLLPALFAENASNPIMEWIKSKPWDKKDRLRELSDTLEVAENDRHYRDIVLRTWLIQCVAAADGAKCTPNKDALPKYELAFILQGGQGAKKTSWFKRLVPKKLGAYIVDGAHLDPADKETVRSCISSWICELGELDSTFRRADISRLKAFLSKQTDTIRLPYDRAESQFGRRTSFCGSVNPEQFLNDSTGSRRFLPLQVTACDSLHIIDMQQLWAQIWTYYLKGWQWWCSGELEEMLKERHERHGETTPIDELIAEVFDIEKVDKDISHRHYTATRILIECGIKEPKAQQASIANAYLKRKGFKAVQSGGVRGFWLEKRQYWP